MSSNKSKISTIYDVNFLPSTLRKVPKKYTVYIPSNLPNNGSPRTVYDRRGLSKYFNNQTTRPPRSPMTRKPVNPREYWSNLYTKEELDAYKHKKSNKYKLVEHMKTRKHLSANQKVQYLNQLKNGKKINNLINTINRSTIPKQNIPNNVNSLQYASELTNNHIKTNHNLFSSHASHNKLKGNKEYIQLFKKIRILILQQLVENIKSKKNMENMLNKVYDELIPQLEKTILAVYYMEHESDISKNYPPKLKFKIDKNKLYDVIEKNLFKRDALLRIQVYIVQSFLNLLYGKYESPYDIRIKSEKFVKGVSNKFDGKTLASWLTKEYDNAINDVLGSILTIFSNHGLILNTSNLVSWSKEPIDIIAKRSLRLLVARYYPNKKNIFSKKINNMTTRNFNNLTNMFIQKK
jgi:hypothetical protein